jgi:dihydroneopterin aldolase
MGLVSLKGVEIYGKIGVYADEQSIGRKFIVDVEITTSLKEASRTDDISKALNYEGILSAIHTQMGKNFNLMETAARQIAEELLGRYGEDKIKSMKIKIFKIKPFLAGYVDASKVEWQYPEDF